MRSVLLTNASFMLTAAVIGNAFYQRQQFYPSVIYITKSNPSMAVIYIQALIFTLLFGKVMRKIFFGRLRAAEFEHLLDRSWHAVTETCLAFTVFKDDFSPKFVALFTLLLFLKSFHWVSEDRVDYMERSPSISALFHVRVLSLALLLILIDVFFIVYAHNSTLTKGASVQLVFGFEYAILVTIVINTLIKYGLHTYDLYSRNPWENKAVFMLYAELLIGFMKLCLYLIFIVIMVRIYTLPLFAVRPMYLTARAFKKAYYDVILSRRAIHNMNTWYPDATADELAATDNVCIICREEMVAPTAKKLPCNHIFHKNCLKSWFQRQQTCPTCRLDILRSPQPARSRPDQRQQQQQQQQQQPPAQEQQQQQQQQRPQIPPFNPNLFAQLMVANARPPAPPTASSAPNSTPTAPQVAPFMPGFPGATPPPPIFMPGFTVPPPMPPRNFSGLTDDELRAMEGDERASIEARIKCLRNIQVLLDAAVLQMQQYSAVYASVDAGRTRYTATNGAATATTTSTARPSSTPASSGAKTGPGSDKKEENAFKTPEETGARPKVATKPVENKDNGNDDDDEKAEIVAKMDGEDTQSELRRRRLQKFDNGSP